MFDTFWGKKNRKLLLNVIILIMRKKHFLAHKKM